MIRKKNTDGNVLFWWVFVYQVDAFIIIWVKQTIFFLYFNIMIGPKQVNRQLVKSFIIPSYIVFA